MTDDRATLPSRADRLGPPLLLVLGLLMAFGPTLLSGFDRVQTDPGDTRLNHYFLESHWRWLSGDEHHGLFQAPMAYPAKATLSQGDLMLAFVPFYAPFRAIGFEPRASFQLWYLTVGALNFLLFFLFLHRGLAFSRLGAAFGAFLFAFGAPRLQQIGHQQLLPQVYVVAALWAVATVFVPRRARASSEEAGRRERRAVAVFAAAGVAQLYGSFYNFFFGMLLGIVAVAWAGVLPATRRPLVDFVARRWRSLAVGALLAAVALAPLAARYLGTAEAIGLHPVERGLAARAQLLSWLYLPHRSWLYGGMAQIDAFGKIPFRHEKCLGIGFLTTAVVLAMAWRHRRRPAVWLAAGIWLTGFAVATELPFGIEPWRVVHATLPGAGGIRALSRLGMWTLVPAAVALAAFVDRSRAGRRSWLALVVAAFCLLEQGVTTPSYDEDEVEDRVRQLARRVDPTAEAFLVIARDSRRRRSTRLHLDAMWASLETSTPTLNCYSGTPPEDYPFWDVKIVGPEDAARIDAGLASWSASHGIARDRIQVIEVERDRR